MVSPRRPLAPLGALLALAAALVDCGGGGGGGAAAPPPALSYSDPAAAGYRLVRDAALSTPTHLVLDLVGPGPDSGRGVAFTLALGSGPVGWARVAPGDPQYVQNILFDLGAGLPLVKTAIQGQQLLVNVFQKGRGNAKALAGPICRVALDDPAPGSGAGAPVPLQVVRFRYLPGTGARLTDGTCTAGTLVAR